MYEQTFPHKRYKLTYQFLEKHISKSESLLDLGVKNPFTKILKANNYNVENTKGEDLDFDVSSIKNSEATVVTAFEIFEHLLNPFTVLQNIKANKLVISVPLRLWFASAYRSKTDQWDRHYHEFEDWQLDWLLEKTGWKIIDRKQWTNPTKKLGIRPILRWFTPRYYIIYAERISK
ncbi:methyltransferase [Olleya aquimaris]|uniref:Methyltransferase n=1 Tax=Olleya sediminilitoris TaxID=2795739 RepID=A0ABS1WMM9_9FLAO|nr:methyltransferase [Olleya sediminilitoris]AXO81378.1 methyltransferase [Olleya aquimaris]MBL7560381.1 methyltransferase [Olleya sediminilitoris]